MRIIALFLLSAGIAAAQPQEPKVDLALRLESGAIRKLDISRKATLGLTVAGANGAEMKESVTIADEVSIVDDVKTLDRNAGVVDWIRNIHKWQRTENGDIHDPPVAGLSLQCNVNGGKIGMEIVGEYSLPQKVLNQLLAEVTIGAGGWIELPHDAQVGSEVKIDLAPLIDLLIDGDVRLETGPANFKFESHDAAKGIAVLKGVVSVKDPKIVDTLDAAARYEAMATLTLDTTAGQLSTIGLVGTVAVEGKGAVTVSGSGKFESRLKLSSLEKSAPPKAAPRQVAHDLGKLGVDLTLPSNWARLPADGEIVRFIKRESVKGSYATMAVLAITEGTDDPALLLKGTLDLVKEKFEGVGGKNLATGLGKGAQFEWIDAKGNKIVSFVGPLGKNRWLQLVLSGDPKIVAGAVADVSACSTSLKKKK